MTDVSAAVVVEGGCSGPNRCTVLRLSWRESDPLAVTLLVTAEPDHPALPRGRWSLLRDYLRDGLHHPVGDGDVRMSPDLQTQRVVFHLQAGGRWTTVTVPSAEVQAFLLATELVLPPGEERATPQVDVLINRLTRA